MRIVFCSAFRNAIHSVPVYFRQMAGLYFLLRDHGHEPYLLLGEGDSTDHTREGLLEAMQQTGFAGKLVDCSHGGRQYGHVISRQRFAQLAGVYNKLWACIPDDAGVVVFLEGDLIVEPSTLMSLIERLEDYSAVAPMVMHEPEYSRYGDSSVRYFFDSWGFSANGVNFTNEPPYNECVNGKAVPLDSAGSCIAMRADVARNVCFPPEDMVVGMTKMLAAQGHPVYLQPDLEICHQND